MLVIGRLAESEDPVLFARFGEVDKCEFIKVNAPEEAWASTEDGAGLLVKADALREQAREVLVSAARSRISPLPQPSLASAISAPACRLSPLSPKVAATASGTTAALGSAAAGPWLPHSNILTPSRPPSPRSPSSGAWCAPCGEEAACGKEGAYCDEEACGGGQERDGAGKLCHRCSSPPSLA